MSKPLSTNSRLTHPALSCLYLWLATTLVVVHPILDVLARSPDFFPARHLGYGSAVLICLSLWILAPMPLIAIRLLLVWFRRTRDLADLFDATVIGVAGATFFFQAFRNSLLTGLDSTWLAPAALVCWGGIFWLWRRASAFRTFFGFLAPALVAVPAVFLLHSDIRALNVQPDRPTPAPADVVADVPVVVVVFDALSASAVMRADRQVNEVRFPHLAALANDSLWFTNATTVGNWTKEAIPAIVTGRYPDASRLPGWRHYPENLFTALADSHRIVAVEPVFQHCPPEINTFLDPPAKALDWATALAGDLGVLFLHRTLPSVLSRSLPPVDQNWGGFLNQNPHRTSSVYQLLDEVEPGNEPTLYFLHALFPHMPYVHLPSGKIFRTRPEPHPTFSALANAYGQTVETQVFLYKRYLFQVGHVDRLVGDLVQRLRDVGLYERSLLVLTSDHGSRTGPRGGKNDRIFIPLLIKLPESSETGVRNQHVSNLDVTPTILDLLGAPEPWPMEGRSVVSPNYRPPRDFIFQDVRQTRPEEFWRSKQFTIDWKIEHFGLGGDPLSLFRAGSPRPDLLGVPLDELEIRPGARIRAEIDEGGPTLDVDLESEYVPVLLRGSLFLDGAREPLEDMPQIAVSLNGTVEAAVTVRLHEEPSWYRFRLTLPESAYRSGPNEVHVWLVDPEAPNRLIGPL